MPPSPAAPIASSREVKTCCLVGVLIFNLSKSEQVVEAFLVAGSLVFFRGIAVGHHALSWDRSIGRSGRQDADRDSIIHVSGVLLPIFVSSFFHVETTDADFGLAADTRMTRPGLYLKISGPPVGLLLNPPPFVKQVL
jgi:hypothetical protein